MVMPGLINLDFADIRAVMGEMGKAMMGTGEAEGDRRAIDAAEAAISNPLLDDVSMKGARGVLINITGGMDMTLFEVDQAANRIREEVDPEAQIKVGSTLGEDLDGRIRVSVIATGIDANVVTAQRSSSMAGTHHVRTVNEGARRTPVAVQIPAAPPPQMMAPPPPPPPPAQYYSAPPPQAAPPQMMAPPPPPPPVQVQTPPPPPPMQAAPPPVQAPPPAAWQEPEPEEVLPPMPSSRAAQPSQSRQAQPPIQRYQPDAPPAQYHQPRAASREGQLPLQPPGREPAPAHPFDMRVTQLTTPAQQAASEQRRARRSESLFTRITGFGMVRPSEQDELETSEASGPNLGIDPADRPALSSSEPNDLLDIPAFLRRQTNH